MYWCNVKFCRVWSSIFFKSVDFFFHRLDQKNIGPNLPKLGTRDFPESDRMHISKKNSTGEKKIGRNDFFLFKFLFRCWRNFFWLNIEIVTDDSATEEKSWKMGFRENLLNQPNQSSRNYQKYWKRNFWPFFAESHSYLVSSLTQQRLHGQLPSTHKGYTKVNRIGLGTTKK